MSDGLGYMLNEDNQFYCSPNNSIILQEKLKRDNRNKRFLKKPLHGK